MGRRAKLALVALYAAAAVAASIPAVGSFRSAFIVDESEARPARGEAASGDHLQSVYRLWLLGEQLERGGAPWRDPYSFQPLVEPRLNPSVWPFGVPFWPLDALFGPVVAWNLLLLGGVVAAGLAAAAWLHALGIRFGGAAVGGLAFAIAPYRLAQSGGHLLGLVAILLPLCLYALERSRGARTRRRAHGFGLLAAAALASIPLSGQVHLALGAVPLVAAYAAVRFRRETATWAAAGLAAAIAVGFLERGTVIAGSAASGGRSLAEVAYYSASWLDLVSRWRLDGLEQYVYAGWLLPVLAAAGAVSLWRRSPWLAVTLALAAVVPVLLALGTNLPLYEGLRAVFPPLRFPRVPGRLMPVATLALAGLAAVAVSALLARFPAGRRVPVLALAAALVAADLLVFPLRAGDADPGNAAYAALGREGPGRALELPVLPRGLGHYGSVYLYYATQEARERPTGYSTLAPGETYDFTERFRGLDCGVWRPGDREELERLGVRFLLFHAGVFEQAGLPGAWFAWRGAQEAGYRPAAGGPAVWLLRPDGGPPAPAPVPEPGRSQPVLCDGWRDGVMVAPRASLWVWRAVTLAAPGPLTVRVAVDGGPTRVAELRDEDLVVDAGAPGWHLVELSTDETVPGLTLTGRL